MPLLAVLLVIIGLCQVGAVWPWLGFWAVPLGIALPGAFFVLLAAVTGGKR